MDQRLYEFACQVYWMMEAQKEYHSLRWVTRPDRRGEAGLKMQDLQKKVRAAIQDIVEQYAEENL